MKFSSVFSVLLILLFANAAGGVELVVGVTKVYHVDGRGQPESVNLWDADTGAMASGEMVPDRFRDDMTGLAMAPDHRLYYVECSERVRESDSEFERCVPTIKRLLITVAGDGSVSYGPEETVYRTPTPFTFDQWAYDLFIYDIAIRPLDDEGNYRVYFSTGGCGACEAEPRIYYLDDSGVPRLYYTIAWDEIEVASCPGLIGSWAGNFDFDPDGELYLSSGNHVPAGYFHVAGAGADSASGPITMVWERPCDGIMDFIAETSNRVYAVGGTFDRVVYQLDPATGAETPLLEIPLSFLDPPTGPRAGIWIQDIDKMFLYAVPGGQPPRMRGPSIPARSIRLPRTGARLPPPNTFHIEGRLIDRLPIPPRPGTEFSKKPDLVVAGLESGQPRVKDNIVTLPFRVFVRNNGAGTQDPFKIAVTAKYPGAAKPVKAAFFAKGQPDPKRPQLKRLASGEVMAVGGTLTFELPGGQTLKNQNISIAAEVDSCSGRFFGLFKRQNCQVVESDEKNNVMTMELPWRK